MLGGGQSEGNLPSNMLLNAISIERLVEGVRLYHQLPDAKLLLSGGGYEMETSVARNMANLAMTFSVPQQRIILEEYSKNTADEAKYIKQIVGKESHQIDPNNSKN